MIDQFLNTHENVKSNPLKSFWMGGFECTDKLNAFGNRVDFLNITGHIQYIDEDYRSISKLNLTTVREGIRWSHVETKPYCYDWSSVIVMIEAGKRNGIQQVWDLCHFGYPDDLTPLHPMFARRFAALCTAFVKLFRKYNPSEELIVTPINEVSFISWLGGEVCGTAPYCKGYGWQVKYSLMKAYIEGIEALKNADPAVRILTSEPLINIVPLTGNNDDVINASVENDYQFHVTDILCGRMCPELRGKPEYLDMIGLNYYYNNQWVQSTNEMLVWKSIFPDYRFKPLHRLIENVYERYNCPVVITETGHPKEHRSHWIQMIAGECKEVLEKNIPLYGICIYPVIDRPDWDDLITWHRSGIWDVDETPGNSLKRIVHLPAVNALIEAQQHIGNYAMKDCLLQ